MGDVGRLARLRAPFQPLIAAGLADVRRLLRQRMATALAPELDALGAVVGGTRRGRRARARSRPTGCCATTSGARRDEAVDVMAAGILALVAPTVAVAR